MSLEERAEGERDHQRPELKVRQLTDVCRGKVQQHVRCDSHRYSGSGAVGRR